MESSREETEGETIMSKKLICTLASFLLALGTLPSFAEQNVVLIEEPKGIFEHDIAAQDRCISFLQRSPFELNVVADSIWVGLSLSGYVAANLVRAFGTYPEYVPGTHYDINSVAPIDRWAMMPFNSVLDKVADGVSIFEAALPVLTYGVEFLFGNLPKKDGVSLAVMYLETFFTTNAITDTIKINALRVRPYMYFDGFDTAAIDYHDFEFSLPSNHTANAFAGATFLTYTFCKYYPNSNWRIPVIATSYLIAAGTGALRMASGNHFFTDVLAGAAIGSACGFLVPFAHTFIAKANSSLAADCEKHGGPLIELAAMPMGLNVSMKF